jgi:hypothetical protein
MTRSWQMRLEFARHDEERETLAGTSKKRPGAT